MIEHKQSGQIFDITSIKEDIHRQAGDLSRHWKNLNRSPKNVGDLIGKVGGVLVVT